MIRSITALTALTMISVPALAQDSGLGAAAQNPISSLISLPFKYTFDNGAPNGDANTLSINPVYPVTVGNWNFVNQILIPNQILNIIP